MCNGAKLTLIRGFADMRLSFIWLCPVIPVEVGKITTRLAVSVEISCKVHFVNITPSFFLTVPLYQRCPGQWEL